MQKFILALLAGLFSPQSEPKPPVAPAPVVPVVAKSPAQVLAEEIAKPPVASTAVAEARSRIKHETRPGEGNTRIHRFTFPDGAVVEFPDRPKRPRDQARRERVVMYMGTERANAEPDSTFHAAGKTLGLSDDAIAALRYISRHEGGFDAINTWDRARFSWGFIQFAGGYGFPPALAHFKAKSPDLFRTLMSDYGVDVTAGSDLRPQPVYVDPEKGTVLKGQEAEQAYGDDPLVIALFIRAGRVTEVKQRQIESAIRNYALPAITEKYQETPLSSVYRSQQGLATLIDRKVHEGNVGRLRWALEHARIMEGMPNPADMGRLEGHALDLAIRDADARASIAELVDEAATLLDRAASAARDGMADRVPEGPSLTGARTALEKAIQEADYRMVVGYRRDEIRNQLATLHAATHPDRMRTLGAECSGELSEAAEDLRKLWSGLRWEYAIRDRLNSIRTSELPGPPRVNLMYP